MLETKKSNLESRLENLRSELYGLTNEKAEIAFKTENFSREINKLKLEREKEESGLTTDDKALLERLQVRKKVPIQSLGCFFSLSIKAQKYNFNYKLRTNPSILVNSLELFL